MTSSTLSDRRPTPAESAQGDALRFGAVHLDVTDATQSLAFWRDLVGLQLLAERDGAFVLGVEDSELVVLHPGAERAVVPARSGLYHLAIHLPSEEEFARTLGRLFSARYPNAPTDHIMHWATYLDDPDGIGLELSFETLDRFGSYGELPGRFGVIDAAGRLRGGTEALDLDEVFSHLHDADLDRPLAAGSRIGHLHLHVPDLEDAFAFYERLGFTPNLTLPGMGFGDLSAGGTFPHRLALNTWRSQAPAAVAPEGSAGLRHATLLRRDGDELVLGASS